MILALVKICSGAFLVLSLSQDRGTFFFQIICVDMSSEMDKVSFRSRSG